MGELPSFLGSNFEQDPDLWENVHLMINFWEYSGKFFF